MKSLKGLEKKMIYRESTEKKFSYSKEENRFFSDIKVRGH